MLWPFVNKGGGGGPVDGHNGNLHYRGSVSGRGGGGGSHFRVNEPHNSARYAAASNIFNPINILPTLIFFAHEI